MEITIMLWNGLIAISFVRGNSIVSLNLIICIVSLEITLESLLLLFLCRLWGLLSLLIRFYAVVPGISTIALLFYPRILARLLLCRLIFNLYIIVLLGKFDLSLANSYTTLCGSALSRLFWILVLLFLRHVRGENLLIEQ